jgi:hypothetical protein
MKDQTTYETPRWKLEQTDLVYAGLAGVALIFVQSYSSLPSLDVAATVSILAFAVALPLLGALSVLNAVQGGYRSAPFPWWMTVAVLVALSASAIGIAAAFWHVSAAAAVVAVVTGLFAALLVAVYRISLEQANAES